MSYFVVVRFCFIMELFFLFMYFFFFKQKTAYEMRISDWSSDVCSSDLTSLPRGSKGGWSPHSRRHYMVPCSARTTRASVSTSTPAAPARSSTRQQIGRAHV